MLFWIAATVLLVAIALIGNNRLVVTRYRITLPGLAPQASPPAAPPSPGEPAFRIVHLSDLHGKRFGRGDRDRLWGAVRGCAPDLIAVSGDVLNKRRDVTATAIAQLRALAVIAPVVFCRGNHDLDPRQWDRLTAALRGERVHLLRNAVESLSVAGIPLLVGGIDDRAAYSDDEDGFAEALRELSQRASTHPGPRILLAHRPEYIPHYARTSFSLSLSGHAHGGQVRIPGIGALWVPDQGLLPRHADGLHRIGGFAGVVSRGLGPSTFPVRIANPPQIIVLECS